MKEHRKQMQKIEGLDVLSKQIYLCKINNNLARLFVETLGRSIQ